MAKITGKPQEKEGFLVYSIEAKDGAKSEYAIPSNWSEEDRENTLNGHLNSIDPGSVKIVQPEASESSEG